MHPVPAQGAPDSTVEPAPLDTTPPTSTTSCAIPAPGLPTAATRPAAANRFHAIFAAPPAATFPAAAMEPPARDAGSPADPLPAPIDTPATTEAPVLAAELNARWAAARLPFQLDRRGVAQLWAVCAAGAEAQAPLLFIIGSEKRAVHQAQRWAALAWPKAAATAA